MNMITKSEWLALAEGCRDAKWPSRAIDDEIALATGMVPSEFRSVEPPVCGAFWNGKFHDELLEWKTPEFTASLDAITALIKQELPTWSVDYHSHDGAVVAYPVAIESRDWPDDGKHGGFCDSTLYYLHPNIEPREIASGAGATETLARCAAFCLAMAEKVGEA